MSEEAKKAERQKRINRAKLFAGKIIYGKKVETTKEDKAMFIVSSFLMIKEHIIKKDTKNNILYVDLPNSSNYFEIMKLIVESIKPIEQFNINFIPVMNLHDGNPLDLIQTRIILIINKIRDSIAHNKYEFDENYENIIINNEYEVDGKHYKFNVEIPLELLKILIFASDNEFNKESIEICRNQLKEVSKDSNGNDKVEKKTKQASSTTLNNKKDEYLCCLKTRLEEEQSNKYTRKISKELEVLLFELRNCKFIREPDKERIKSILREYGLIDEAEKVIEPKEDDPAIDSPLIHDIIREISRIIPVSSSYTTQMKVVALFNYMQTLFSIQDTQYEFLDKEEKLERKLHLLNLHQLKPNINSEVSKTIKYKVKGFIKNSKNVRDIYMHQKTEQDKLRYKKIIINSLNNFIKDIYECLATQNAIILSRIRNSVMHANIGEEYNVITLQDLPDKSDPTQVAFECYGTPEELFEVTSKIENPSLINNTLSDEEILNAIIYYGQLTEEQIKGLKDTLLAINEVVFGVGANYSITDICAHASTLGGL